MYGETKTNNDRGQSSVPSVSINLSNLVFYSILYYSMLTCMLIKDKLL